MLLVTVFLGLYCRYIGHSIFSYFCTADIIVTAYISRSVLQISWSMCSLWEALRASGAPEKYIGQPTFMLSHAGCCKFTTLLHIIHHHTLRFAVASHSSPRTLRSSALHVSHDSWALSDPHVSSPARCEAIMGSPLSMLANHYCDILLHFSSAFEIRILCTYCLLSSLPSTWSVSAFEFRSS